MADIQLSVLGTYQSGIFDDGAAEINAFDASTQRLFVINSNTVKIDVLDLSDPTNPTKIGEIDATQFGAGANSIAINDDGLVAVAIENNIVTEPGQVIFFNADLDLNAAPVLQGSVTVGALPDMVTFTPDGSKVLVANEGEPDGGVNPEGSISIIDVATYTVQTADFTAFNSQQATLEADGLRIFPGETLSDDVEPEYIAVSADGTTAYVTLQEANAVAVVDIASATVTEIQPLGLKDHSLAGNGLDASDRDSGINIDTEPVVGMYMPDAIAIFESNGQTYYVTANEGDDRGDADDAADNPLGDAVRLKDLADVETFGRTGLSLDPSILAANPNIADDDQLGRLTISTIDGDTDGDGDIDQIHAYGARSFSIFDSNGNLVYDSGDEFEQITAAAFPADFNANNDENNSFESRSDNKGPEPEGVTIGEINGKTYAFVGLERIGGIMVYDITDPANSTFVQYINNRDFSVDAQLPDGSTNPAVGDLGPEGLTFISAADSPNGQPLLAVSNEVSGSTTVYEIGAAPTASSDLIITGIIDGPLSGGVPKAIELYAVNDIPDLSIYGIGSANNGGGTDGEELTLSGSASAGDYIYIASEDTGFSSFFGFAPDFTSAAASINGDDAIELFKNGEGVDIFGDINVDGSGQPWEYQDGWAYRVAGTGPDGNTFELSNWTFSGPNALDNESSNGTAATPFPLGSFADNSGNGGGGGGVFTLELLHAADQEAGAAAVQDAPNFSAVLNALRAQDLGNDGIEDNTLTLSSGDAIIPGLFFDASEAVFGSAGIADIQIQNELGFQAIALGNHEFDFGTATLAGLIDGSAPGDFSALVGTDLEGLDFTGAAFPYLATNLDFSTDANLAPLDVAGGQAPQANVVTSSTVIDVNGEGIGVVGATTPTLDIISNPGGVGIAPADFDANPTPAQLDALAAEIQAEVDALLSANPAMNKVVLLAHMQQIDIERALAARLENVDIIVAGGSNTRLFDANDRPRAGDSIQGQYPEFITNAGGTQTALVNTDGGYKYVGRLVIDFDAEGHIIPESYDPTVSGAYATDAQGVADLNAEGLVDPEIQAIADAIEAQIIATEGNVFGISDVFLNGNRSGVDTPEDTDGVRTQETNLGNLTADANLAIAKEFDPTVVVSIKNGGGIRASIGQTIVPPGGTEAVRSPNEAVLDSDGNVVKPEGGISQNDIQTTLAFNNGLTLLTLTKAELVAVLEHGVGALPGVSGRFPQLSGVKFSYDPDLAEGDRILSAGIFDENDTLIAELVRDGEIVGDANETFRIVTLNFLAGGGDGYPFPTGPDANRVDLSDLDGDGVSDNSLTGDATFAADGTEQDALAEYLFDNFNTAATAFDQEDTGRNLDERIQNLNVRSDTVFDDFTGGTPDLVINELRISSSGSSDDTSNFVELFGDANTSLDGLTLVVLSGEFAPGQIDVAVDLTGGATDASGVALIANSGTNAATDAGDVLVPDLDFFGSPSTFLLVEGFTGTQGTDLDTDNDGILDRTPWTSILDSVSLIDGDNTPDQSYSNTVFGPDGNFTPAGIARDPNGTGDFRQLAFGDFVEDSPGEINDFGSGTGTTVAIYDIQGAGHVSPFVTVDFDNLPADTFSITGDDVVTTGIVTAVDTNGFYLHDPVGDGNIATSDAIFVFTGSNPGVNVGDELEVAGTVAEFFPGGTDTRNLPLTQLVSPTITTLSTGNALPAATIIGQGGRIPPSQTIDDDAFGSFDPETDGIDFFESLEAMRVTAQDAVAVGGTNRFGEIFAVVDGGADATGISDRYTLNISPDDFNPEKIQIDEDTGILPGFDLPEVDAGAVLGDVTGVISYDFGNFQIQPTAPFTPTESILEPEVSEIVSGDETLTVASYNVLNLDPNDGDGDTDIANGRFEAIAQQIISNLNSPDIIGLQEVQDNNGSADDGTIAADQTLQRLIDAIAAAGGPTYAFIDNTFITDGQSGGQPGGNIRNAFLYNPERVDVVDGSVQPVGSQDAGEAFDGARLPLAATFEFNGEEVTIVNNHFSSKGGSAPILGIEQPFDARQEDVTVNGSLDERQAQSAEVQTFVSNILAADPNANVIALGDLNEFEFVSPVTGLESAGLTNLTNTLDGNERYTFIFQGNSQSLDHILVSDSLTDGVAFDIVHVNSEFAETSQRASDHDPLLAGLQIAAPRPEGDTFLLQQKPKSLKMQAFRDDARIGEARGRQNGVVPDVAPFTIAALDSPDSRPNPAKAVDRTFLDRGEGIGIADGDDRNQSARKRIDGDEVLEVSLNGFEGTGALIELDRVDSVDGAMVEVKALAGDRLIDTQTFDLGRVPTRQIQTLLLDVGEDFNTIQIAAGDTDTEFTFRSVAFQNVISEAADSTSLSFGQRPNKAVVEVLRDGLLIGEAQAKQNRTVPDVTPFSIGAVDSTDTGRRSSFEDVTFFDRGEGIGIADGDDRNAANRKRIDGDEILGIAVTGFQAEDALINVDRVTSDDGAMIRVESFKGGTLVDSEVFDLGSVARRSIQTLNFGSAGAFDALQISAADSDTQFTFRSVELPEAFTA